MTVTEEDENAIKKELAHLEHQYAALRDEFVALNSIQSIQEPLKSKSNDTGLSLNDLETILSRKMFNRGIELRRIQVESLHRFTGVTAFLINDPDPADQFHTGSQKLLGIRIESMINGRFIAPHYIILKKRFIQQLNKGSSSSAKKFVQKGWILYRHTIPLFIDTIGLFATFCPSNNNSQGLKLFVKHVRKGLVYLSFRASVFTSLPDHLSKLVKAIESDEAYMSISLLLGNKKLIHLKCSTDIVITVTWSDNSGKNYEVALTRWLLGDIKGIWIRLTQCLSEWTGSDFEDFKAYSAVPFKKLTENHIGVGGLDNNDVLDEEGNLHDDDGDENDYDENVNESES
ncbi:hypothetical protein NADFUDRAFT_48495 [Nadsonia fulvescens var. elongata DSM 6958]|uniref:Uncharacterized protein n=1 Tax=Nadsonia fulvescens var. elongata DSM 6958 TaxID=857566 RepID=A0A1E3PR75_9ASCO|nr:hypothetical protein NADFUDRAFT_48495 [Nadsonia fulvescens var. elongata DSM 6958]